MSQVFDDFSKFLAGVPIFRLRSTQPIASTAQAREATAKTRQVVQNGPCAASSDGMTRTVSFSTTISRPHGLMGIDVAVTRGGLAATKEFSFSIHDAKTPLIRMSGSIDQDGVRSTVEIDEGFGSVTTAEVYGDSGVERFIVNGEVFAFSSRSELFEALSTPDRAALFLDQMQLRDIHPGPGVMDAVREIALLAQRTIPGCVSSYAALDALEATAAFVGCDACKDKCDDQLDCYATCAVAAAACGPFYGVCLATCGAKCLEREADCFKACIDPPGPCCPKACSDPDTGTSSCCQGSDRCCGSTCCDAGPCCGSACCDFGEICASAALSICCEAGAGEVCKNGCCPPGYRCANPSIAFCCEENAGEYCPTFAAERCCPPGEWCADRETGTCCPKDSRLCGAGCCPKDMICDADGVCCDERQLCNGRCCLGICRGDECCSYPSQWCDDVCCPPFNNCCPVEGHSTCCGAYDVCMKSGCCPTNRVCGEICCPGGYRCVDPAAGVCESCGQEKQACVSGLLDGSFVSICCPPNVTCCRGDCCQPGEICCDPMDGEGARCLPSHVCIH